MWPPRSSSRSLSKWMMSTWRSRQPVEEVGQARRVRDLHPDVEPARRGELEPLPQQPERPQGQDDDDGRREPEERQAGARGHADPGGRPEARGGREAADRRAVLEDRARAQEPDAGHDLGRDA